MKRVTTYKVKYLPTTNTKGSRVKITNITDTTDNVTLPYDYSLNGPADIAVAYLKKLRLEPVSYTVTTDGTYITMSDEVQIRLKD